VVSDLQCPVRVYVAASPRLGGQSGGRPPGERLADVLTWTASDLADVPSAFGDLADRYRGEAVLVVVEDERGLAAVEEWSGVRARDGRLVIEGDADGWRIG
jgi:hypothetical protein